MQVMEVQRKWRRACNEYKIACVTRPGLDGEKGAVKDKARLGEGYLSS